MEKEILDEVKKKKEFSEIPEEDILKVFSNFEKSQISFEEKIKKTRNLLRKIYSGFGGKKLFNWKDKGAEDILKKHLSTRERFPFYEEIYSRLLKDYKNVSIIDLGAGVNGFSFDVFSEIGKNVDYLGVEAVGQLVDLMQNYFEQEKKNACAIHLSLFEKEKVFQHIKKMKKPKVVFLFKVIDSLEKLERNYTLDFLEGLKGLDIDKFVVSFATESWHRRRKFFVERKWLINFIRDNFDFVDDFKLGGERYLVFRK